MNFSNYIIDNDPKNTFEVNYAYKYLLDRVMTCTKKDYWGYSVAAHFIGLCSVINSIVNIKARQLRDELRANQ